MGVTNSRGLFLMTLDIAEQVFSVPIAEREALLLKLLEEKKAQFIGTTDKTAPELATDLIKSGVKARSYVTKSKKCL